jgi:hypothetical protein
MKALILLLIPTAALTNIAIQAQDRLAFEEERCTTALERSYLNEQWGYGCPIDDFQRREQWLRHSRAQNTTCYRLPGGRVVCSQGQGTNPSNGGGTR